VKVGEFRGEERRKKLRGESKKRKKGNQFRINFIPSSLLPSDIWST
jgi:hypothetical protein